MGINTGTSEEFLYCTQNIQHHGNEWVRHDIHTYRGGRCSKHGVEVVDGHRWASVMFDVHVWLEFVKKKIPTELFLNGLYPPYNLEVTDGGLKLEIKMDDHLGNEVTIFEAQYDRNTDEFTFGGRDEITLTTAGFKCMHFLIWAWMITLKSGPTIRRELWLKMTDAWPVTTL